MRTLAFFVPSNRVDSSGLPTHVDGMNEIIAANRAHRQVGAAQERENVKHVEAFARVAMLQAGIKPPAIPAHVTVTFVEVNRRRDVSNVFGGLKWVLDGLSRPRGAKKTGAGAIYDDSSKWVEVVPRIEYDPARPGVQIEIEYMGEV